MLSACLLFIVLPELTLARHRAAGIVQMHDATLPACGRLAMNQPEDNMQSLETRLRAIEDHIAIQSIIAAYGPAVDTPDGNVIGAAYAKTGRYQAAEFVFEGPEAVAGLVDIKTHQDYLARGCAHVLSPHHIKVSGDTATAQGHSVVFLHGVNGWAAERVSANHWAFIRTVDGWKVTQRLNRLLDGSAAARALLAPCPADHPADHPANQPTDHAPSATIT
ncbi:nuclear transport factor 2 family protein [Pseudorhodobacter sp.]|uniref:nuclear transport factor 2 family protein n=1 Tax=Pseudorhodobacter sp. TaxID=1934400 RepID=UPI002AFE5C87|nr:nuclear transport factor 2 family protein [Pseudorhodobacter sp.]